MTKTRIYISREDPLQTLRNCHAVYDVPHDEHGSRVGPLVAFTSTYVNSESGETDHYIGDSYFNLQLATRYIPVSQFLAESLGHEMLGPGVTRGFDTIVGVATGAISFGTIFARHMSKDFLIAQKADPGKRIDSYALRRSDGVCIVEDVINTGNTVLKIIGEARGHGVPVRAIACIVNRSANTEISDIPIFSVVRLPHYRRVYMQHEPFVESDVRHGRVVWHPKQEWETLMDVMDKHS